MAGRRSDPSGAPDRRPGPDSDGPGLLSGSAIEIPPEYRSLRGRWIYRLERTGEILEFDVIAAPTTDWHGRIESADPLWKPIDFGGLTLAVKALC